MFNYGESDLNPLGRLGSGMLFNLNDPTARMRFDPVHPLGSGDPDNDEFIPGRSGERGPRAPGFFPHGGNNYFM